MNGTIMALQQHLGNACRRTEVTVYLERWMSIEEIGEGTSIGIFLDVVIRFGGQEFEHVAQDGHSMVAIEHTSPEAYLPTQTPACCFITTILEGLLGSSKEFVVGIRTNLVGREESIEVRDVTMMIFTAISINEPLLQLLATAYLHRRQLSQCLFECLLISSILAQYLSRFQCIGQGIEDNLVVHGASCRDGG